MNSKDDSQKKVRARGSGIFDPETGKFGFTPFNEAPSTQRDVKSCRGGGKRWTTTGADPSRMVTLKAKESSADMYGDLLRQFNQLTRDLKPQQPLVPPAEQRVVSEGGLQCWLNRGSGMLTFTGTVDLTRHERDWQAEVLRQVQLVVRRLPACEAFNQLVNNLKKERNNHA